MRNSKIVYTAPKETEFNIFMSGPEWSQPMIRASDIVKNVMDRRIKSNSQSCQKGITDVRYPQLKREQTGRSPQRHGLTSGDVRFKVAKMAQQDDQQRINSPTEFFLRQSQQFSKLQSTADQSSAVSLHSYGNTGRWSVKRSEVKTLDSTLTIKQMQMSSAKLDLQQSDKTKKQDKQPNSHMQVQQNEYQLNQPGQITKLESVMSVSETIGTQNIKSLSSPTQVNQIHQIDDKKNRFSGRMRPQNLKNTYSQKQKESFQYEQLNIDLNLNREQQNQVAKVHTVELSNETETGLELCMDVTPPTQVNQNTEPELVSTASMLKVNVVKKMSGRKASQMQFKPLLQHLCDSAAQIPKSPNVNEQSIAKFNQRQQRKRNNLPSSFTNYKLPKTPEPTCLVILQPVVKRTELIQDEELIQTTTFNSLNRRKGREQPIVLGQNQRMLRLHKLNLKKMKQDYRSFDEWHKVDQIFMARDELVRAEQNRIKSLSHAKRNSYEQ